MSFGLRLGLSLGNSGGGGSAGTPWSIPLIFTNSYFAVNLVKNGDGSFGSTYSAANFVDAGSTYYVSKTGNDTTGDGSSGNPWATTAKAFSTAPSGSIINVGPGRFAPLVCSSGNFTVYCTGGQTFFGDMLTGANVSAVVFLGGSNTVTLSSGTLYGILDTTKTQYNGKYQSSKVVTSAGALATERAAGNAACYRATPSQVTTSDGRDLTGKFDTDIIAWKSGAAAPLQLSSTARIYVKDAIFVGGAQAAVNCTRFVNENCTFFAGTDQAVGFGGGIIVSKGITAIGSALSGADIIDYTPITITTAVEIDAYVNQCNRSGADNCSTAHGNVYVMRINGQYLDGSKPIHDVGTSLSGVFGCTTLGYEGGLTCGAAAGDLSEMHVAGHTFLGSPSIGQIVFFSPLVRFYFYDQSFVGKSVSGGTITDHSGTKPTSDATLLSFDFSNMSSLFQDTTGTTPVTTVGQTVARVNDTSGNNNGYAKVVSGSFVLASDGTHYWASPTGTANTNGWQLQLTNALEESCNLILGVQGADASVTNMVGTTQDYLDYRSGAGPIIVGGALFSPNVVHRVDASATSLTTRATLNAAAFTAAAHVLTHKNINLMHDVFTQSFMLRYTTATFGYDGKFFGMEVSRYTTDAATHTRELAMGAKSGATVA